MVMGAKLRSMLVEASISTWALPAWTFARSACQEASKVEIGWPIRSGRALWATIRPMLLMMTTWLRPSNTALLTLVDNCWTKSRLKSAPATPRNLPSITTGTDRVARNTCLPCTM